MLVGMERRDDDHCEGSGRLSEARERHVSMGEMNEEKQK